MNATKPTYEIVYNGKNITGDILHHVLAFTYTDKASGETDELEIQVEDKYGLWRNEWYPIKGDTITARIYHLGNVLQCGTFTVDEMSASGGSSGDTVSIKAIAAGINKQLRTRNCYAHENKTLREIANTVAAKHELTLEGNIDNIRIGRETQYDETDLGFLQRVANEYGYTFSVRDNKLTFTSIFDIENKKAALSFSSKEIISWSITDKTAHTYKAARVVYHNRDEKEVIDVEHKETTDAFKTAKVDNLILKLRAENTQQAEAKAKAALYRRNSLQQEGSMELPGNVFAIAGNNCIIEELGVFSGLYYIKASTHTVSKDSGYTTSIEIKRVGLIEQNSQKVSSSNPRQSILPELELFEKIMTNMGTANKKDLSMDAVAQKIEPPVEQLLIAIEKKGYREERNRLSTGFEAVQDAVAEDDDRKIKRAIEQQINLIKQIHASVQAKMSKK